MKEYKSVNIRVKGKVQGVWFRASALIEANQLGLKGFVKNEPDGSVYAEVEGTGSKIKAFAEWCKTGPENALVKEVIVQEQELKNFTSFEIQK